MDPLTFPYAKQSIDENDAEAVRQALFSPYITRGKNVEEFERSVADYCGARYAVAFNSGTTALAASGFAIDVNRHDRLITTPNTFVGTLAVGWHEGAEPIFVDIERETANMDLALLEKMEPFQSTRGRSIYLPVHFGGIPIDLGRLNRMISDPEALIIEDAAHALGSYYPDGTKVGSCHDSAMTCFSFHPAKQITSGEGGMVLTNDEILFNRLKLYRNNGIDRSSPKSETYPWYYEVKAITGNFHMNELQASLGLSQFKRIDSIAAHRRELMKRYFEKLRNEKGIRLVKVQDLEKISFHLALLQIDFEFFKKTREEVMNKLKEKGIGTQVHYIPIYKHPFFAERKTDLSSYFPETETYYKQCLSFPLYTDLKLKEVDLVVEALLEILKNP